MKPDGSSEIHEGMTSNKNDKHMERFEWILLQRHNKSIVIFNKYIYAKKIYLDYGPNLHVWCVLSGN